MTQALIKTPEQLALMREAGRLLAQVFTYLDGFVAPGLSTLELDAAVEHLIRHELKARPASKGQYNYPYCINTSINEVVCHGMPHPKAVLKDGDIINIDITLEKNGYIADSSKMYLIGTVGPKARRLVDTTFEAMWAAIKVVRPGARLGDIGHAIQAHAEAKGYSVVREYCGHGIGQQMHEEPQILHFGRPGTGLELREGMVFTIEPMLNQGSARVRGLKDGWTVVTRDNGLSAQWEHTVAVTRDGFEVLTLQQQ
ncbi:MAG: type I methionyl aminopeptidase [Pseudomonas protegens]|uniref:type I methionyl aminopeptidase n=1 Tax=Pseudomonas protegens TaxID=380021 RepID=UPI000DB69227|nr:type I methionyl aminopeptidase [Pseudomonas protegens]MBP5120063.1 type I methionyl aminopeptidase [Pseudomonas protegens]PZP10468.1 MAG: type I methionyl aminopeptidase [Pseudomonas protegens]QTU19632.1 type I methionyl aminopeptidase [Pseudomonas protegens]